SQTLIRLGFLAEFDSCQQPGQTSRHVQADRLQALLAVFAAHRHRKRRQTACLNACGACRQGRAEWQRGTWTGTTVWPGLHFKARAAAHRFVARPRSERRLCRVHTTMSRGPERGAFTTEEMQFGIFEGQLRVVLERRCDLASLLVQRHLAGKLYEHTVDRV